MTPAPLDPLLRAHAAAAPRTLVDIWRDTVTAYPDELAVDSGVSTLRYAEMDEAAAALADRLAQIGVGPGDRVGIRVRSGTTDLYVAILGVLNAGAAYVPVDADDPDERARVVFAEAGVAAVVTNDLAVSRRRTGPGTARAGQAPEPSDDAWVIFTSGSTGTPKGVAVTHRNAAAFVDAEARLFLRGASLGPGDRVMAGLSVAFDASCEEMWLAWAYGACLVPAPRSLVRSGVDVGPWLVANDVTVVSTVPTLVALWPPEALAKVRLVILGGEACPPELAARLQAPGREVWNTYGPTEATVVACAALVTGEPPLRIGLPLDGWDLAVVDGSGQPVAAGESGELIIGGVGLARYLDPAKDAEKYAPMPSLGWSRAYRSGDVVVNDPDGLLFTGRVDDQIKLGGRRIELGELDGQLTRLPGVSGAAAAVRTTASGNSLLVGYLTVDDGYDGSTALTLLRERLPAALVPRLAVVAALPTKTSGKVDRDALPWPLPASASAGALHGTQAEVAQVWREVLGADPTSPSDDFFAFGGGSLTAAQVVSRLRPGFPDLAVGDVYSHPTLAGFAAALEELAGTMVRQDRTVSPIRRKTQVGQILALFGLRALAAARWLAWLLLAGALLGETLPWLASYSWWVVLPIWAVFGLPPGRMLLAATMARVLLRDLRPGSYPRGGKVHLRVWLAARIQDELHATSLGGAGWFPAYARWLGARIGSGVDLHSVPPVTGLLTVGRGVAIEPEVDLSGTWIDGDRLHVGSIVVGAGASVGTRSMLGPGAVVGADAQVAPGSFVPGEVPAGQSWSGAPAEPTEADDEPWQDAPQSGHRAWVAAFAVAAGAIATLPAIAAAAGAAVLWPVVRDATTLAEAIRAGLPWLPVAALTGYATLGALVLVLVRGLAPAISPGEYRVRSLPGLAIWTTVRILDEARTWLFPLYSAALTPWWLRALGARIGPGVEASTVLMIPKLTQVNAHAFLADDTLIGGYQLSRGMIRVERVKVGKRAFVGNSGMAAPGRKVPKAALVAVLSAAPGPGVAKAGSCCAGWSRPGA